MKFRVATVFFILLTSVVSYLSFKLVYMAWEMHCVNGQHCEDRIANTDHNLFFSSLPHLKFSNLTNGTSVNEQFRLQSSFPEFASVDCRAVFEGDVQAIGQTKQMKIMARSSLYSDKAIHQQAKNCEEFRRHHGYNSVPITKEEREFPIAYSIVFHKDIAQVNILLKAIYRPHNLYCLHLDAYSSSTLRNAAKSIATCFTNIFLVSRAEYITYGGFSRLRADINCMNDLLSKQHRWNYIINLPGQEFPLKTNLEIVKILKIYNGSNDIEGITGQRMLAERFRYKYKYVSQKMGKTMLVRTNQRKEKPPHNITVVKGSAYGVFSRHFVQFVVKNKIANDFLQWCKDISSPDEYFWATLNHNTQLGTPGGYSGNCFIVYTNCFR